MAFWFDKQGKRWRYTFIRNGKRYSGSSKSEMEANMKYDKRRVMVDLGIKDIVKQVKDVNLGISIEDLRAKYKMIYDNPKFTLPDILDMAMADLHLPYGYKDVSKIIKASVRQGNVPAQLRAEVLAKHNFTCQWCGAKAPDVKLNVDHIIPVDRGGKTEERNLQVLCHKCNIGKSNNVYHLLPAED